MTTQQLKQLKRIKDARFALGEHTGERAIRVIYLWFDYENGKKITTLDCELLNNNPWAVTHFLKRHSTKYYTDEERAFLKEYDEGGIN